MILEDLVPPLELCRPIAHLFPDSPLVWVRFWRKVINTTTGEAGEVTRPYVVDGRNEKHDDDQPSVAAPTISEMMRLSADNYTVIKEPESYMDPSRKSYVACHKLDTRLSGNYVADKNTPEQAWAALIAWQIEQGLLPKAGEK